MPSAQRRQLPEFLQSALNTAQSKGNSRSKAMLSTARVLTVAERRQQIADRQKRTATQALTTNRLDPQQIDRAFDDAQSKFGGKRSRPLTTPQFSNNNQPSAVAAAAAASFDEKHQTQTLSSAEHIDDASKRQRHTNQHQPPSPHKPPATTSQRHSDHFNHDAQHSTAAAAAEASKTHDAPQQRTALTSKPIRSIKTLNQSAAASAASSAASNSNPISAPKRSPAPAPALVASSSATVAPSSTLQSNSQSNAINAPKRSPAPAHAAPSAAAVAVAPVPAASTINSVAPVTVPAHATAPAPVPVGQSQPMQFTCQYGAQCTRRNPHHWIEFQHPPGARRPTQTTLARPVAAAAVPVIAPARIVVPTVSHRDSSVLAQAAAVPPIIVAPEPIVKTLSPHANFTPYTEPPTVAVSEHPRAQHSSKAQASSSPVHPVDKPTQHRHDRDSDHVMASSDAWQPSHSGSAESSPDTNPDDEDYSLSDNDEMQICRYDAQGCYRRNPEHARQFRHPSRETAEQRLHFAQREAARSARPRRATVKQSVVTKPKAVKRRRSDSESESDASPDDSDVSVASAEVRETRRRPTTARQNKAGGSTPPAIQLLPGAVIYFHSSELHPIAEDRLAMMRRSSQLHGARIVDDVTLDAEAQQVTHLLTGDNDLTPELEALQRRCTSARPAMHFLWLLGSLDKCALMPEDEFEVVE